MKFLDASGLSHLWQRIRSLVSQQTADKVSESQLNEKLSEYAIWTDVQSVLVEGRQLAAYVTETVAALPETYVQQEPGKGLSSNDYTDADMEKLRGLTGGTGSGTATGSTWHTGTALSGEQSTQLAREKPNITLVPGNFGDPGNGKTASITLTAQRELTGVAISGEFHVEEYYDDFSLIVNGEKVLNEAHGERSWQQWWSGSLESGQAIQLIYTKDNSTSGSNEEQTRFEIACDDLREDSFAIATGSTPVESWTYTLHAAGPDYAEGDYYLNTEELTLYRCAQVSDGGSSWDYLCTLGIGGADLGDYVTRDELSDYATQEDLRQLASVQHINSAIVTLDIDTFESDGQPHAPKVQSVLLEGRPLTENVDYALAPIHEASAPGSYSAIAIGIGQYAGAASAAWRVNKPAPNLQLSQPSLTVKGVMGTSDSSVIITRLGSGRLSAESLSPQYATASVVGSALRVTSVKPGSAEIVVRADEDDDYAAAETRLTVEIQRADGSISVQPQSLSIDGAVGTTATATITKTGSGAVSVSSSPYVTSRVSGTQLTLASVSDGSASLTLSLAQTDDYTAASCSLSVQVIIDTSGPSATLADNSWSTILEVAAKGDAQKYWKAGDVGPKVTFTLPVLDSFDKPTSDTTTLTCDVRILGFDHDDLSETDEKYSDPSYNGGKNKAAISFEMVGTTADSYPIEHSGGLYGWAGGENVIRDSLFPTTTLDSFAAGGLRTVAKKTSGMYLPTDSRSFTDDKLFILAYQEITGTAASNTSDGEGAQYAFYKNGGSKRKQNPSGSYANWWTRTSSNIYMHQMEHKAYMALGYATDQSGLSVENPISICFCV